MLLEHPFAQRDLERREDSVAVAIARRHQLGRRPGERGRVHQHVERLGGQAGQPTAENVGQTLRHPRHASGPRPRPRVKQLTAQFEGEERVARGGRVQSHELWSCQLQTQPVLEQAMHSSRGERRERAVLELSLGKHALQLERRTRTGTKSHHQADTLVPKPPERDLEHAGRRRIKPLDVVQRDHHRPAVGQSPQRVEHGQPDGMCVWALVARLLEQQRDTERPPARAGKRRRRSSSAGRVGQTAQQTRTPPRPRRSCV